MRYNHKLAINRGLKRGSLALLSGLVGLELATGYATAFSVSAEKVAIPVYLIGFVFAYLAAIMMGVGNAELEEIDDA